MRCIIRFGTLKDTLPVTSLVVPPQKRSQVSGFGSKGPARYNMRTWWHSMGFALIPHLCALSPSSATRIHLAQLAQRLTTAWSVLWHDVAWKSWNKMWESVPNLATCAKTRKLVSVSEHHIQFLSNSTEFPYMAPGGKAGPCKVKAAPVSNSSITRMMWISFGHSRLKCAAWCVWNLWPTKLASRYSIGIQVLPNIGRTCPLCVLFFDFWIVGPVVHGSTMVRRPHLNLFMGQKKHGDSL